MAESETRAPPMARGADRISDLPKRILGNILSRLPARDAVRTCVLAKSWRNRWWSAPALHIAYFPGSHGVDGALDRFVDGLLSARRGGPPLHFCGFDLQLVPGTCDFNDAEDDWIRRALELKVRVLRFRVYCASELLVLYDFTPFSSQHLTSLELMGVSPDKSDILDFSGCLALENLWMEACGINSMEMHSPSLKHLSIKRCQFEVKSRIWMAFPSLVSFEFIDNFGRAPMLERMPHLEAANVQFGLRCFDICKNGRLDYCGDAACTGCSNCYPHGLGCVFLRGFLQAKYLNLSAYTPTYVFSRDLKWCPAFNKLKTLVLGNWFVTTDLSALIWFLHHTPLLEKLTLEFPETLVPIERSDNPSIAPSHLQNVFLKKQEGQGAPAGSHLQNVEIKCKYVDGMVLKALKILNANGIPQGKIKIQCSGYDFVSTGTKK